MTRPILLDLFCGAGGAGMGYYKAGFDVLGVDIDPQPNYPFDFTQGDVTALHPAWIGLFDAVHASPPCQAYTTLAKQSKRQYPDLVAPTRDLLRASRAPYVIENVPGAPLLGPVMLCGTMFPALRVIRHRMFEASFALSVPPHMRPHPLVFTHDKRQKHYGQLDQARSFVQVTGGGNCTASNAREAMGIDWMTKREMNEAIPPAYTEYLGQQFLAYVRAEEVAA